MIMQKQRTTAQSTESIIGLGKSKRLAAIRHAVEMPVDKEILQQKYQPIVSNKERQIQQARDVITQSIAKIKATFPQGKQKNLFALRYGSKEKINQMSLKKLFTLLNISEELAKEIAEVRYESA